MTAMRKRQSIRAGRLQRFLAVLLSLVMILQGTPYAPAFATEMTGEETTDATMGVGRQEEQGRSQRRDAPRAQAIDEGELEEGGSDSAPGSSEDGSLELSQTSGQTSAPGPAYREGESLGGVASSPAADAMLAPSAEATVGAAATPSAAVAAPAPTLQAQADEVPTATSFYIKGARGNASRTAPVKYVDQFRKSLYGTVTGTSIISYDTDNPGILTDVNSYDLYSLKDKLADSYRDDYEFSRVYIDLNGTQKDFRHLYVGTDRDIHGSGATATRVYTLLNDIKEDTKPGGVYYKTWYTLPGAGNSATNTVYIEYNHVREVAFSATDEAGGPVEHARYALYSDEICYTEYEYIDRSAGATDESDHVPVTAVSAADGSVSFGKIPYGTYYMKETQVPDGYKDRGTTYKVVVGDTVTFYKATADGYRAITEVVHEWADGSIMLNGLSSMTVRKRWDGDSNGAQHADYEVTVEVYSQDVVNGTEVHTPAQGSPYTLNSANNWSKTIGNLDPKLSYVVAETSVKKDGVEEVSDWIPEITAAQSSTEVGYFRADAFKKGEAYVLSTGNGEALSGAGDVLGISSLAANTDEVTGSVTNDLLWRVERINNDGVITLHNMQDGKYLDYVSSAWTVTDVAPKFVRHTNSGGDINLYYRENTNTSSSYFLTVRNGVISSSTSAPATPLFDIYQKIDVKTVDVSITNKRTTYPVRFRNCLYDTNPLQPLGGMKFAVYTEAEYEKREAGRSSSAVSGVERLVSGEDGYMRQDGEGAGNFSLEAGTYYLVQREELAGHRSFSPVKFIVTRAGMMRARQDLPNFEYTTTVHEGETDYLVLQVPSFSLRTVTVGKVLVDDYVASPGRQFDFTAKLVDPNEDKAIVGWDFGSETVSGASGEVTFRLAHGETRELVVPVGAKLVVTETTEGFVTKVAKDGDSAVRGNVYERIADANCTVTFTNLRAICKIVTDGGEKPFESISAALDYARTSMPGQPVTVQMLVGTYRMSDEDNVVVGAGEDVTVTTAARAGGSYAGLFPYLGDAGTTAVILRDSGNTLGSLFTVSGTGGVGGRLTLDGVALDGGGVSANADGGLVRVEAGSFEANSSTALRNSSVSGNGGALYVAAGARAVLDGTTLSDNAATSQNSQGADVYLEAGSKALLSGGVRMASTAEDVGALYLAGQATGSEIEVAGDLTDQAFVHVWAEDAGRDGVGMTADEPFGITSLAHATDVVGLERIVCQRAGSEVTAAPGANGQIVWTKYVVAKVRFEVSGDFADTRKEFGITFTVPASTPAVTGSVNTGSTIGEKRVFKAGENTLTLAHGQELVLSDARAFDSYVFRQTNEDVSPSREIDMADGLYDTGVGLVTEGAVGTVTLTWNETDAREFSLSDIRGTRSEPAVVLVTNYLGDTELPATGIDAEQRTWLGVAIAAACLISLRLYLRTRRNLP